MTKRIPTGIHLWRWIFIFNIFIQCSSLPRWAGKKKRHETALATHLPIQPCHPCLHPFLDGELVAVSKSFIFTNQQIYSAFSFFVSGSAWTDLFSLLLALFSE